MTENTNDKVTRYLIGGTIGLLIGLAATYLLNKKREESDGDLKISSDQGMKIGLGVVSLLKTISESGKK